MSMRQQPTTRSALARRDQQQRQQDKIALAHRHAELVQSMRQLRQLMNRLELAGTDPHSRRLAAAIVDQMDELLPDILARESRAVLSGLGQAADTWTQQAAAQLRADQGWISTNWYELRPRLDGIARDQSWVDLDLLRDAAELFCSLQREHVSLATTLLERDVRHAAAEAEPDTIASPH